MPQVSILLGFVLTLTALKYFRINHGDQRVLQFEITMKVSVSSLRFFRIPMLAVYGHYKYVLLQCAGAGIDFSRQNLTSTDVRF